MLFDKAPLRRFFATFLERLLDFRWGRRQTLRELSAKEPTPPVDGRVHSGMYLMPKPFRPACAAPLPQGSLSPAPLLSRAVGGLWHIPARIVDSAVLALALALLAAPVASAAELDDTRSDSDWFSAYCIGYYDTVQCNDALRFIRKTYGFRHIAILLANDEPQSYLASLRMAVEGGQAMRIAVAAGDKARQ